MLKNQVQLLTSCSQIQLLTNEGGAAQTKKTVPTVATTKALAAGVCAAQQNEYDNATGCWITADDTNVGPKLLMAARSGDTSWVQTLLSAPDKQSYINYTDRDGRTPLFTAASKGHSHSGKAYRRRLQRQPCKDNGWGITDLDSSPTRACSCCRAIDCLPLQRRSCVDNEWGNSDLDCGPQWARCCGGETHRCALQRKYSDDRWVHGALTSDSKRTHSYCDYDS